jgi:hypothetical protein
LIENKDKLDKLAKKLLEEEVIFKEDLEVIFGKRPFSTSEEIEREAEKAAAGKLTIPVPKTDPLPPASNEPETEVEETKEGS